MSFGLGGHVGTAVSALVDGQLLAAEEDRLWSHVLTCPPCRRLVEREGWVKTQLAGLSGEAPPSPVPSSLIGSLHDLDDPDSRSSDTGTPVWHDPSDPLHGRSRRMVGIAALGAGSVGMAVFGFATLSGPPAGDAPSFERRAPLTSLTRQPDTRPSPAPGSRTSPTPVLHLRSGSE